MYWTGIDGYRYSWGDEPDMPLDNSGTFEISESVCTAPDGKVVFDNTTESSFAGVTTPEETDQQQQNSSDEESVEGEGECTSNADCENDYACATMTAGGLSVDQCVATILCGETMELEGMQMSYACMEAEEQ